jgi:hypothetical protein
LEASHLIALFLLPKHNRGGLAEVLCKPKILPLRSAVLEQLRKIERANEELVEMSTK